MMSKNRMEGRRLVWSGLG